MSNLQHLYVTEPAGNGSAFAKPLKNEDLPTTRQRHLLLHPSPPADAPLFKDGEEAGVPSQGQG